MSRAGHPPSARLRRPAEFQRVLREGRVHPGREVLVRLVPNACGRARLGVAASRRYGNAVVRNRFKRLVREAFRSLAAELGPLDVFVAPRRGLVTPTLEGIRADLRAAPAKAHAPGPRRGPARKGRS